MAKNRTTKPPHKSILRNIQAVVFDFDGVFTDNRVIVSSTGEEFVVCDRGDGMGTGLLKNAGIKMLILSKEQNSVVSARAKKLNLEVIQGRVGLRRVGRLAVQADPGRPVPRKGILGKLDRIRRERVEVRRRLAEKAAGWRRGRQAEGAVEGCALGFGHRGNLRIRR